jgi:hypothetical protein
VTDSRRDLPQGHPARQRDNPRFHFSAAAHADARLRADRGGKRSADAAVDGGDAGRRRPGGRRHRVLRALGNLAIFDRDFGYSSGLVRLGSIESGIDELAQMSGDITVTIELGA